MELLRQLPHLDRRVDPLGALREAHAAGRARQLSTGGRAEAVHVGGVVALAPLEAHEHRVRWSVRRGSGARALLEFGVAMGAASGALGDFKGHSMRLQQEEQQQQQRQNTKRKRIRIEEEEEEESKNRRIEEEEEEEEESKKKKNKKKKKNDE